MAQGGNIMMFPLVAVATILAPKFSTFFIILEPWDLFQDDKGEYHADTINKKGSLDA